MSIYLTPGTLWADASTPSNTGPAKALNVAQLEALWVRNGGSAADAPTMARVAQLESGGVPNIVNPNDSGIQASWGLFQLSNGTHAAPGMNWADPDQNAAAAVQKFNTQGPRNAWPNTYPMALGASSGETYSPPSKAATDPYGATSDIVNEGEQYIIGGIKALGKDILGAAEGAGNFLLAPLRFTAGAIAVVSNLLENLGPLLVFLIIGLIGAMMLAQAHRDKANEIAENTGNAMQTIAQAAQKFATKAAGKAAEAAEIIE